MLAPYAELGESAIESVQKRTFGKLHINAEFLQV
jgi:hypothetical protein